ncbi:VOC family protein [Nocardia sp. NPDC057668]|uniref:VOC family protein n=1 Tax=Nocardia sp. NPDC057668 TaxID=3346202 RepID=UPI0036731AE6
MTATPAKGIKTVLYPVSDLTAAKALYTALLGVEPEIEGTYYVGFTLDGHHIGLVPDGGPQGNTTPVIYWEVPDIEAKLAELGQAGAREQQSLRDTGNGRRVAEVLDADGNILGLLQDR